MTRSRRDLDSPLVTFFHAALPRPDELVWKLEALECTRLPPYVEHESRYKAT